VTNVTDTLWSLVRKTKDGGQSKCICIQYYQEIIHEIHWGTTSWNIIRTSIPTKNTVNPSTKYYKNMNLTPQKQNTHTHQRTHICHITESYTHCSNDEINKRKYHSWATYIPTVSTTYWTLHLQEHEYTQCLTPVCGIWLPDKFWKRQTSQHDLTPRCHNLWKLTLTRRGTRARINRGRLQCPAIHIKAHHWAAASPKSKYSWTMKKSEPLQVVIVLGFRYRWHFPFQHEHPL